MCSQAVLNHTPWRLTFERRNAFFDTDTTNSIAVVGSSFFQARKKVTGWHKKKKKSNKLWRMQSLNRLCSCHAPFWRGEAVKISFIYIFLSFSQICSTKTHPFNWKQINFKFFKTQSFKFVQDFLTLLQPDLSFLYTSPNVEGFQRDCFICNVVTWKDFSLKIFLNIQPNNCRISKLP